VNLPNKKYNIIYADPPWAFNSKKSGGSMKSGALNKYPTMSIQELKDLAVGDIAADNCILVMWWVASQPQEAIDLCKAWGFRLTNMNGFVWNKLTAKGNPFFGMGHYTRAGSESALIGIKGKTRDNVTNRSVRAVRTARIGRHSAKPVEFADDIVQMCGDKPRIELFARDKKEGWDNWGNEL